MRTTRVVPAVVGTLLVGAAIAFAPAASANGNVGWNVSIGVPGIAISAGAPAYYGTPYRPYYRPHYAPNYRPVVVAPPVVYRPYYAPYRYYAPRPVVYGPRYYHY